MQQGNLHTSSTSCSSTSGAGRSLYNQEKNAGVTTAGNPDASAGSKLVAHLAEVFLQRAVLVGQA